MFGFVLSSMSYGAVRQISSIEDLQKIGNDPNYPLNGEYELTQDIDASETINWNNGAGFAPIGNWSNPFTGKFDGKGYKITRLYINRPFQDYVGLFGYTGSVSEMKNVGIENCYISGNRAVGGLVGRNSGTVSQCYSTGSVAGLYYDVGGLVGGNLGTVSQCYSTASVAGLYEVGGLVGYNSGTVSGSYSTSLVSGVEHVGGLVGRNYEGTVSQCYSTASVAGLYEVGGLVGRNDEGTVSDSYAMGSVSGSGSDIGGLIGRLSEGSVTNTYSTGFVGGSGSNKGGLIGYLDSWGMATVTSSYWDMETSGMTTSAGGTGKTTAQMKQRATYAGWDFVNVWGIEEGVSYPYLLWRGGTIISEGEGSAHEGATEGTQEGAAEGSAHEGTIEGTQEGTAEGSAHEGTIEGMKEGEGDGGGTDRGCGCNKKAMGSEAWWKYLVDFVIFGLLISLMSGMGKSKKRKE